MTYDVAGTPPLVRVDEVLFDAIVSNILENVADHTPAGTPIRIGIAAADRGRIRIVIEDGGPGVAPGEIDHLFDKFQRAGPPSERARRGMGIGLSIVRGMTEALGGQATARASDLGGLAIELDLPAAPDPDGDGRPMTATAATGAHILLVEDDEATRRSVAANLVAHDYRVVEAGDVRTGARALGGEPAGRHPARPRPARRRRARPHPPRPARRDDADPRALGT